ncbi:thioester reductase domain-containing protein [Nocardia zapadnayensis]|uniref:carboxylic acid reductase n=1 Tax=Nocardia rhamnosiphila TaxID=426716 RepID=UPI0022453322|nr:carboxylic acid reductase [Nocardia zapadnayensis]MCX0272752.1 thioester reductase domain-containing protein [Nocardia zapadnayensis]
MSTGQPEARRNRMSTADANQANDSQPSQGLAQAIDAVMTRYADRPALARRATELVEDSATGRRSRHLLPEFTTLTYLELWSRARAIATAWSEQGVKPGDRVVAIGFASVDYVTVHLAVAALGGVFVPLQAGAPVEPLRAIVAETEPRVIAASTEHLAKAAALVPAAGTRTSVVLFDDDPDVDDDRESIEATSREFGDIPLESLRDLVTFGRTLPTAPLYVPEAGADPLTLLIYTSGSTGAPKGAMYLENMLLKYWTGKVPQISHGKAPVIVSYMPMGHMFGLATLWRTFQRGGTSHFTAYSNLSTLFEDIALAKPTEFYAVPRILDQIYQIYQSELANRRGEFSDPESLDAAAKTHVRETVLGGRIQEASAGSAPISAEMKEFVRSCLGVPLRDAYGMTETGNVLRDGKISSPPVIAYKLADTPELGYHRTDKPYPRGELLVKTENIIAGYYRRPELTESMFDADGFYRTGDIMAEVGEGELIYVDRRNNVQKLSQGEFVTISQLEETYTDDPAIRQIYVYGNSAQAYLLAVIVPTAEVARTSGGAEVLRSRLSEALQSSAKRAELESYEIPRDFLIEEEPFSTANGLLSEVGKLLRPRLRERYGERLEQLYATLARSEADELQALRTGGPDQPVYETVGRAAQALLGCPGADLRPDAHFTDLGGDSLSALTFSNLLADIFEIDVPVSVVISPAVTLETLSDYIRTKRTETDTRPSFASVHGAGAAEIRAGDLTLDRFVDTATLDAATRLPAAASVAPETVLLTGATGYLGRFLCIDWLEILAARGGKLICLVRAADEAAARRRLEETFDTGDEYLLRHYRELAANHLEVLAGDLGEYRLGLGEDTWRRLVNEVDTIVHPGALVNHMLPYDQLFGPNVIGTAELIRLAITGRIKPFTNLSTIAVSHDIEPARFDEVADIRAVSPVRRCHDGYANGYGNSKWAGEVLLREAYERFGLPVTVFRSDMILTHSRYTGQLNVPDMFTRLMLSVVATGLAPRSFYSGGVDGARPRAHYDGLPADFSSAAVTTLGGNTAGYHTYHLINPHDDGISLDTFVDWLIEAGHGIQRLDYGDWLKRVEAVMRNLPEKQRQRSLLPLLKAYERPLPPANGATVRAPRLQDAVAATPVAGHTEIPHLTRELILKYVADLRALGLL